MIKIISCGILKYFDTTCLNANPPLQLILYQIVLHSHLSCDMYSMPFLCPRCFYTGFCLFPAWWLHPVFCFFCDHLLNPKFLVHHTKCYGLKEVMFLICFKWVTWTVMFVWLPKVSSLQWWLIWPLMKTIMYMTVGLTDVYLLFITFSCFRIFLRM